MSISSLMQMTCTIKRNASQTVAQKLDSYGSFDPSPQTVASNVVCDIQNIGVYDSKLKLQQGMEVTNLYLGFFLTSTTILNGDTVECTSFSPSTLYVKSVNPIMNKRTGIVSHQECVLGIEAT